MPRIIIGREKVKAIAGEVLKKLFEEHHRATLELFHDEVKEEIKKEYGEIIHRIEFPPPSTFYYWLNQFLSEHEIRKMNTLEVKNAIAKPITESMYVGEKDRTTILANVESYLIENRILFPAPEEVNRLVGEVLSKIREENKEKARKNVLGILNTDKDTIVNGFLKEFRKYPPVFEGKPNLAKMAQEFDLKENIKKIAIENNIEIEALLELPEIHASKEFIEYTFNSVLDRHERTETGIHIIKYLAGRYQDAIDAIIQCFIKKVRLMKFVASKVSDENAKNDSLSLITMNNIVFKTLSQDISKAIEDESTDCLNGYREVLEDLHAKSNRIVNKEGYYDLLSRRYMYSRKLSLRLKGLKFKGMDKNSKKVVEVLDELFKFKPFSEVIPDGIVSKLGFLDVPVSKLKDRKIFEPIVLINLADRIWRGRIVVENSGRYRNKWAEILPINLIESDDITEVGYIEKLKENLNETWEGFNDFSKKHRKDMLMDGKLKDKRLPAKMSVEESERAKVVNDSFMNSLPSTNISHILKVVNRKTGYMNAFTLNNPIYTGHLISEVDKEKLCLGVILAKGMNVGLKGIVRALGDDLTIGRLTNFYDNYVSIKNLTDVLARILNKWDELGYGEKWGDGMSCSSDGKVMFSFLNNLISRYHYRKGKSGVTIYWFVRNDWIASYVQIIGNDEWESWYVLDGMMHSYCNKRITKSCGDTQGQLLSLWGLGYLLGIEIRARFRDLKSVKLFKSSESSNVGELTGAEVINWKLIEEGFSSVWRLVETIKSQRTNSKDILSTWNIYDEAGFNVMGAVREIGKAARTIFILNYVMDKELQQEIREGCNRAEFWNKFQDAVFWGKGGGISSNDRIKQQESALFMMLIMNSIVFYNACIHGDNSSQESDGTSLTPVFWHYINFLGKYDL